MSCRRRCISDPRISLLAIENGRWEDVHGYYPQEPNDQAFKMHEGESFSAIQGIFAGRMQGLRRGASASPAVGAVVGEVLM